MTRERTLTIAAAASVALVVYLFWPRRLKLGHGTSVGLSNGNIALLETPDGGDVLGGRVSRGRYIGCMSPFGEMLPDSECRSVFNEYPGIV